MRYGVVGSAAALVAMAALAGVGEARGVDLHPEPIDPEPDIDQRQRRNAAPPKRVRYGSGPKLEHATEADAHTDADRARIAAAIAKRERKAKR